MLCLLMIIISTVSCLAGCKNREEVLSNEQSYETKEMVAMRDNIVKCINSKDKNGFRKLFSKSAQVEIESIDNKIDELINLCGDDKIIYVHSDTPGSSRLNHYSAT